MAGQAGGRRGGMHLTSKALLDQVGEISRVVNVGVGQDHGIDVFWGKWKFGVALNHFLTSALEEAAIQEDLGSIDRN